MADLDTIYARRFADAEALAKEGMWSAIAAHLQRYIPRDATVLDIACDRGHFIRHVQARERWATDLRDMRAHLSEDIQFRQADGLELDRHLPNGAFDVAFMSNYLEHLPSPEAVVKQLEVCLRLLRPGGRVIVLQPNIRLVGGAYWDFIDHHVALTEKSLAEAAGIAGFQHEKVVRRFLPYTTKSRLPQSTALVRAYLAFPPAWRILGKQTLYIGKRP